MIAKYSRKLEARELNPATDSVWAIQDVPAIWQNKVRAKVEADHYTFDEDGTAIPVPPNDAE